MTLGNRIFTVGTGTALAQIVTAISTPLLTRMYAPEAHAAWAIYFSICVIIAGVATLRFELAVVLPPRVKDSAALYVLALAIAIVACLIAGPLLRLIGPLILSTEHLKFLPQWTWLIPVTVFSTAVFQVSMAWCTRRADFKTYALGQFSFPVSMVLFQLSFAAGGVRDSSGLIFGTACGQVVTAGLVSIKLWRNDAQLFVEQARLTSLRKAAKQHRKYPLYMTPYTVTGLVRERLAFFLIGRIGETATVGYYGLVSRLINLPNSFVASAVRPVFFQHAANRAPTELAGPMLSLISTLGIVGAAAWGPCVVHAEWLCGIILGDSWRPAAPYAIALSLPAIPLIMGNWADRMFDVLGRQRAAFFMELSFSGLAMCGLLLGYAVFGELLAAVWVQSGLLAGYYLFWLTYLFRAAGFSRTPLYKSFCMIALIGFASLSSAYFVKSVLPESIALLCSFGILGFGAMLFLRRQWLNLQADQKSDQG